MLQIFTLVQNYTAWWQRHRASSYGNRRVLSDSSHDCLKRLRSVGRAWDVNILFIAITRNILTYLLSYKGVNI